MTQPLEIQNLTGLEKPLEKLIEVCAKGVGAVARPWLMKREAKALVEANRILEQGDLSVSSVKLESFGAQIEARVQHFEARRQRNLYRVMDEAKKALPANVAKDTVDDDWTTRFFAAAQDISDEHMQQLWGRILSGEVAHPGSFCLRTLDLVRNLTRSEAEAFTRLSAFAFDTFVISPTPTAIIWGNRRTEDPRHHDELPRVRLGLEEDLFAKLYLEHGLDRRSFERLQDIGLLAPTEPKSTGFLATAQSPHAITLPLGPFAFRLRSTERWMLEMPCTRLTSIGTELLRVTRPAQPPHDLHKNIRKIAAEADVECDLLQAVVNIETGDVNEWVAF